MPLKLFTTQEEWDAWYRLTPQQRFAKSAEFLQQYLATGGSLDPDYDPQSPFNVDFYPNGPPFDEPQYVPVEHLGDHGIVTEEAIDHALQDEE